MILVRSSLRRWKVTTPAFLAPVTLCQAIRCVRDLLGDLGVPLFVDAADLGAPEEARVVQLPDLDSTPSMNRGNSSNCVHWL